MSQKTEFFMSADGLVLSIDTAAGGPPPEYTRVSASDAQEVLLNVARADAVRRTISFSNQLRERIAASQHYLQAARWPVQLAAAQAIKNGVATEFDTTMMTREARLRGLGETVDQLADKVLVNSQIFANVGAAIDGIERATKDRIGAYAGTEAVAFDVILADAQQTARAELASIYEPVLGSDAAKARTAEFFAEVV